jgi:IS5 family transposase
MRPKQHEMTGSGDLFRATLEQIINLKHELVQLAGKLDWEWIDGEIAPLYSDQGRPGIATRFVIGLLLLKHIYGLSDEGVCERWVHDPYFQYFTGEEFFQHSFPHERSDLSHWRKRLGDKLELLLAESLRVTHASGALRTCDLARVTVDTTVQPMRRLARSMPPKTLAANGYALYVKFRPGVPTGVKGWGARGKLDLTLIRRLTKPSRSRH